MNKNNITKRSTKTAKPSRAAGPARPKRRRQRVLGINLETDALVFDFDEVFNLLSREEALRHGRARRQPRA